MKKMRIMISERLLALNKTKAILCAMLLAFLCLAAPLTARADELTVKSEGPLTLNAENITVLSEVGIISRYSIKITKNGKLDITAADADKNYGLFHLKFRDADGKMLHYSHASEFKEHPFYVTPGIYYVDIEHYEGSPDVLLKASFLSTKTSETEPNDDRRHALPLPLMKEVKGFITAPGNGIESSYKDNEDWYTFTLKKKDSIAISVIFEETIGKAVLYNKYMQEVQKVYKYNPSDSVMSEPISVPKGKYYIKIDASDIGIGGRYYLTVDSEQAKKVAKVKDVKIKAGKKKFTVSWKKIKDVTGYQVFVSQKKSIGYKKALTIKDPLKVKATIKKCGSKKLVSKKKYFVRIRAYKKLAGEIYYGKYSTPKSVKVK